MCFGFMLLSAVSYRYAVKSTALIWSPLLWALRPASSPADIRLTMSRILTSNIYKASRIYSLVVAVAFLGKIYIWIKLGELQKILGSSPILESARDFIVLGAIPPWHITSVANAFASWVMYFIWDWYYKVYTTKDDAKKGTNYGGSGFFVGIPSRVDSSKFHSVAVTR
jgi:hypothetical protein